jgi:hypothetical protein
MVAIGRGFSMVNTMAFRAELQPITPERFLAIDSSSSSRQKDLVFVVNPQGFFLIFLWLLGKKIIIFLSY